jgi:mevalonate pyrophosphate decarboxylase
MEASGNLSDVECEQNAARIPSRHVRFLADRVRRPRMQRTIRLQQQLQNTAFGASASAAGTAARARSGRIKRAIASASKQQRGKLVDWPAGLRDP